jgi:hypothetical protein
MDGLALAHGPGREKEESFPKLPGRIHSGPGGARAPAGLHRDANASMSACMRALYSSDQ